jgi:hypothetical protein
MSQARETARQKALAGIKKKAGEDGDWKALEAFLRLSFPANPESESSVRKHARSCAWPHRIGEPFPSFVRTTRVGISYE